MPCFICGDRSRNHVIQEHHLIPRRYGGSDSESNLYRLCSNCHVSIEKMYNDAFYDEILTMAGIEGRAKDHIAAIQRGDIEVEIVEPSEDVSEEEIPEVIMSDL